MNFIRINNVIGRPESTNMFASLQQKLTGQVAQEMRWSDSFKKNKNATS